MKIRFSYIISALCMAIMIILPMENTLAQGRGGGGKGGRGGHTMSGVRISGSNVRGPRFGSMRTKVPRGAKQITFHGNIYHWRNGAYYHPHGKKFVIVRPPLGLRIGVLPLDYFMLTLGTIPYYYYYGTFYTPVSSDEYEVVDPPVGAWVRELPNDYEVVTIDDKTYYKVDDTYYRAVVDTKNNIMYEVVGKSVK